MCVSVHVYVNECVCGCVVCICVRVCKSVSVCVLQCYFPLEAFSPACIDVCSVFICDRSFLWLLYWEGLTPYPLTVHTLLRSPPPGDALYFLIMLLEMQGLSLTIFQWMNEWYVLFYSLRGKPDKTIYFHCLFLVTSCSFSREIVFPLSFLSSFSFIRRTDTSMVQLPVRNCLHY